MILQKKNFMTIYVHKSTRAIVFKALQANERTTLSSGVYRSISKLRSLTRDTHATLQAYSWS